MSASYGAVYKVNKDGSGYSILRNFLGTQGDGQNPGSLLSDSQGVLYGATQYGGLGAVGCVFALSTGSLPPRVVAFPTSGGTNLLQCAATSGFDYSLLRSTNLVSWSPLTTVMSTNDGFAFPDVSPPQPAAFYRLLRH